MANITENTQNPAWSNGIYQIETSDPVLGGANGIANRQAKELAARTQWLRTELSKAISSIGTNKSSTDSAIATKANNTVTLTAGNGLTGGGNLTANRTFALGMPSIITASTTNSVTADSHTHAIDKASTSVAGIVQLNNTLTSTATNQALTAAQGKALNDKITANASDTTTNLATKANNTVTLTAGNGLTGGGNLTANRTFALGTPSIITASTTNSVTADSHTHAIDKASTSVAGIVQLNNTLTSTATNQALTAAQGKVLNDKITNAKPVVYAGLDLDNTTTAQFYKNASKGYPEILGGEHAGLIIGFDSDCLQIASGGRRMFIRGSDANPITADSWSDWAEVLTTTQAYQKNEFALKKAQNGYCKLPNGLIFQWGIATILNEGVGDINFNIAFPNAVYIVQLNEMTTTGRSIAGAPDEIVWDKTVTTTEKFNIKSTEKIGQFAWFAIGI